MHSTRHSDVALIASSIAIWHVLLPFTCSRPVMSEATFLKPVQNSDFELEMLHTN